MTKRVLLGGLALVFALLFQGSRPLADPDEGRYAEAARGMLVAGDPLMPRIHAQPHLTKPPGTYWATAAGIRLLGANPLGARLGVGLAFALWIGAAAQLGRRLDGPQVAPWCGLALATSILPFFGGSLLTADIFLAALDGVAVAAAATALTSAGSRRRALRAMWLALGLAFVVKGPPALLPLAGLAVAWPRRAGARDRELPFDAAGLALFAITGLGWFAWLAAMHGAVLGRLLHEELVAGPLAGTLGRSGPFWMPTAILAAGTLPWGPFLLARLGDARSPRAWGPLGRLLGGWLTAGWFVFTFTKSRMPLYVLPLALVPAVLAGVAAARWSRAARWRRTALIVFAALSGAGLLVLRAHGDALRGYRHSAELAARVAAVAQLDEPILLLQQPYAPGLAFALQRELSTVARDAGEALRPHDFEWADVAPFVAAHPAGVLAIRRPVTPLPHGVTGTSLGLDPPSGYELLRLRAP